MQKPDSLLRTKLHLPFTRPDLVLRPRLQARILEGMRVPLTLITAPAGFGKTTLVASCVARFGMPVTWLSLDKNDNQEGRFLTYLIATLQAADHRIGVDTIQLMGGIQQASEEAVLTSLINDLDNTHMEMALVLDDYQVISSQAVHEEVTFLLDHAPYTFHLIIATRSDPPLPLARLRARGQMVEIRAADLRFTTPETAQFLNEQMRLNLDDGSVNILETRTEGWIAGLQMASIAIQSQLASPIHGDLNRFIEGFSGTNRHILDYLLEEVLASQPAEIQRFLLYTAILERLTAPLCDALVAEVEQSVQIKEYSSQTPLLPPSTSTLRYLERENLFLVALDDAPKGTGDGWFRYHHLFADLLRARMQQSHPAWIPFLHKRAAAWLEKEGFIADAIQHLLAAHEENRAADLIEQYGPVRWAESDPATIQMADGLPMDVLLTRPKVAFFRAWLFIIHGQIGKALPILNDIARYLSDPQAPSGQAWILTLVGCALAFLGRRENTPGVDMLPHYRTVEDIPADEEILRDAADILYGMTLGRRGEVDRAADIASHCIQRLRSSRGVPLYGTSIPTMVPFLARIYLMQGRLSATAILCHEYLDPLQKQGVRFIYSAGSMNIALGEVLYERNDLEGACQKIRDGLKANEPWVDIMTDAFGLIAMIITLSAQGNYHGAMQMVEKLETRLEEERSRPFEFEEAYRTIRIRVQLASGDLQGASNWADHLQYDVDYRLHPDRYRITLARIRLAQGKYADVEHLLAGEAPPTESGNHINRQIETALLKSTALSQLNRLPEALALVENCLRLAEPEGYIRVFVNEGPRIRRLIERWQEHASAGPLRNFADRLLTQFKVEPEPNHAQGKTDPDRNLVEPLTPRELDVLRLLSTGLSNRQIAERLFLSEGTVKFYVHIVMEKLGVHNRTQAILSARDHNLL